MKEMNETGKMFCKHLGFTDEEITQAEKHVEMAAALSGESNVVAGDVHFVVALMAIVARKAGGFGISGVKDLYKVEKAIEAYEPKETECKPGDHVFDQVVEDRKGVRWSRCSKCRTIGTVVKVKKDELPPSIQRAAAQRAAEMAAIAASFELPPLPPSVQKSVDKLEAAISPPFRMPGEMVMEGLESWNPSEPHGVTTLDQCPCPCGGKWGVAQTQDARCCEGCGAIITGLEQMQYAYGPRGLKDLVYVRYAEILGRRAREHNPKEVPQLCLAACECGAAKCGDNQHSDFCPLYVQK